MVSGGGEAGAPVVTEDNPTLPNLIGLVEHCAEMGALVTDFTLIKSGALHRANGGYLMLDATKVLMQPLAWEALKRALKTARITLESAGQKLSIIRTVSQAPAPTQLHDRTTVGTGKSGTGRVVHG